MRNHEQRTWVERLAGWCVWSAILAAAVWWFVHRERPSTARQRLAVLCDPTAHANRRRIAADNLQGADVSLVPPLLDELRDGDSVGRELAALALGRQGETADAAIEPLVWAASDREASVRRQAVIALGRINTRPEVALKGLRSGARDNDAAVRDGAYAALGWLGEPGIGDLVQLVTDGDADARRRAVIELGRAGIETPAVITALRDALSDGDPRVRSESYAALCNLSDFDADELFAGLKGDTDPLVRMTALRLLAKRQDKTAEMLIPALNDEVKSIRLAAVGAVSQMGPDAQAAVPALTGLLDSGDPDVVWGAANALGRIGPAARGATERLLACVGDQDFHTRSFANHALRRIGREGQLRPPELFAALKADGYTAKSLILWDPDPLPGVAAAPPSDGKTLPRRRGYGVTDDDLEHVKNLTQLVVLNLSDNPVGDDGLANLTDLKELKYLSLWNTNVTSAGLRHLAGLKNLERLNLAGCDITDAGMVYLKDLHHLRSLAIWGSKVTDAGLAHLHGLVALEEISQSDAVTLHGLAPFRSLTEIALVPKSTTDADLPCLKSLTRLRTLGLSDRPITDQGLQTVGKLPSLEYLFLNRTQVTDAGLVHLKSLVKLRFVSFDRTNVSPRGAEELKTWLPNVTISGVPGMTLPRLEAGYEVIGLKPIVAIRP